MSELNAEQIRELVKSYLWLNDMDRKDVVADAALAYADLLEAQVEGRAVVIVKENGEWPARVIGRMMSGAQRFAMSQLPKEPLRGVDIIEAERRVVTEPGLRAILDALSKGSQ